MTKVELQQMELLASITRGYCSDINADLLLKLLDERARLLGMLIDIYSNPGGEMRGTWPDNLLDLILDVNDGKEPEMLT